LSCETAITAPDPCRRRRRRRCAGQEERGGCAPRVLDSGRSFVRVGVLATGDTAVRAAHSLAAHPVVDDVVVIGPAKSKNFKVVETADECDLLVGAGAKAPAAARRLGAPLVWDGESAASGVSVWGASPQGLTLALASRETDPRLVALAHPAVRKGSDHKARFPDPLGKLETADSVYGDRHLAVARSPNQFAACLAIGADRRVTIVDDGAFLSGVALGAGVAAVGESPKPVWAAALAYLRTATEMGLVMAEDL